MRVVAWMLCGCVAAGAQTLDAQSLDAKARQLSRDVFQQMIETNTTLSVGSTTELAEKVRARLLAAGFAAGDMEIVGSNPKRKNLVVHYRPASGAGDAKPVLVFGHIDVVEAKREDWPRDPFKFTEEGGYFYGRGTQDMKSQDAAWVTSFILLKQAGWAPKREIILALTADEEGGADNGVDWLMKNRPELKDVAFGINPDAGGLLLKNGKPEEMDLEATEKVYADFVVMATNPGGHSSRPVPDNAIYEVADALGRLEKTPFPAELNEVTRAYLTQRAKLETPAKRKLIEGVLAKPMNMAAVAELSKDPGYNATLRTTCVATMINGGHAPNALPGSVSANVNCRILPGHSPEEVRQKLVAVMHDARVAVKYKADDQVTISDTAPDRKAITPPPLRDDLMKPLKEVTAAMWPGIPVLPEMESGASDSIYTMAQGIPSYGFSGMGIDEDDVRAHGRDERIRVEAFYAGVAFTREVMKRIGEE